jgi:hypothetical protein
VIESTRAWRPCSKEQDGGEEDLLATLDAARRFEASEGELRLLDRDGRVLLVLRRAG